MTLALANRKDAIKARLDEVFTTGTGYGFFTVKLTRQAKHTPRAIKVSWVVFPFEDDVRAALGDLATDDVIFDRTPTWSCGRFHADAFEAWKEHEGAHHLVDEDSGCCPYDIAERVLPEDVEEELRADGETFESDWCTPGNYLHCPTCGGGARYMPDRKTLKFEPCPDCARLGTDRQTFPGVLDLDVPEQRDFYTTTIEQARAKVAAAAEREQAKREAALTQEATYAVPTWLPLPSRAGGVLNGLPVAPVAPGCDYLTHAGDENRRVRCSNDARWFEATTGLRVCTRHRHAATTPGSMA